MGKANGIDLNSSLRGPILYFYEESVREESPFWSQVEFHFSNGGIGLLDGTHSPDTPFKTKLNQIIFKCIKRRKLSLLETLMSPRAVLTIHSLRLILLMVLQDQVRVTSLRKD